eukprot:scaffold666_cov332-Prasinococcus_capsulatus_cf.AAC.16
MTVPTAIDCAASSIQNSPLLNQLVASRLSVRDRSELLAEVIAVVAVDAASVSTGADRCNREPMAEGGSSSRHSPNTPTSRPTAPTTPMLSP